jgi:hypothetical protein
MSLVGLVSPVLYGIPVKSIDLHVF